MKHKLAEDTISKEEIKATCQWITEGNRLTKGEQTLLFESEFSKYS